MKRVSKIRLFVLLLLLSVGGGCTQSFVEEDDIPPHALKDVDAGFTLKVLATRTPVTRSISFTPEGTIESDTLAVGVKDSVQTKAAAPLTEEQESRIASLWVGQYDATTGARLFNQYIPSMTGTTVNLKLKQSQNDSKSHVYFIPNAGDLGAIADETTLKKHTLAYASSEAGLPESNLCKMQGMWAGVVKEGGTKDISVELTRLVAKITFTYSMGEGFAFTPSSVRLKNAPSVSQVEAPLGQLSGITYKDYTGTVSDTGATIYWYLPENMAGTVDGENVVGSEKNKTGRGVTNATCIELTGTAVQGGVTYGDVTFRFYPGSDRNNYDIIRNSHYTMTVKLVGIDVSDERITVGEIPPIVVDPAKMPAKKGGEKEIQITARPGQPWEFNMPAWLSALLDGKEITSGATITHQGPANVVFKATTANPNAEERSVSFNINVNGTDQKITITQSGATLTKGNDISLAAEKGSEGESSFTTTKGLQWLAALSGDGWLDWSGTNPGTSGDEAPEEAQALKVQATSVNPSAQARSGKITVKAGASVGDAAYTALKKEINVTQVGSEVTGGVVNVNAEAASSQSTFRATAGLDWALSVADDSWITLTGSTSGTPTTGSAQNVTFNVAVNPSSSQRQNDIIVRAGNETYGPIGTIKVKQKASQLEASADKTTLAATEDDQGTLTYQSTKGLPLSITVPDWLTLIDNVPDTATGDKQTLKYKTSMNLDSTDNTGNILITAGEIKQNMIVTQKGSMFEVSPMALNLETAATSGTITITGTNGLPWTISSPTSDGISVNPAGSTITNGQSILTINTTENTGEARLFNFTINVTGGNHSKVISVYQEGIMIPNSVAINQKLADVYMNNAYVDPSKLDVYPAFAYDTCNITDIVRVDINGNSSNLCQVTKPYIVEVESTQISALPYANAIAYCKNKGGGWRVPTIIELFAMWYACKGDNNDATDNEAASSSLGNKFFSVTDRIAYMSSSVCSNQAYLRCTLNFSTGVIDNYFMDNRGRNIGVRCVREVYK